MIRTTKQKFGAGQCQALEDSKQQVHIMAGFLAYAILNLVVNDKKKLSVDALVNQLREFHYNDLMSLVNNPARSRVHHSIDPDSILPQNALQNSSLNTDTISLLAM